MDINFKVQFFLFLVKDDILKSSLLYSSSTSATIPLMLLRWCFHSQFRSLYKDDIWKLSLLEQSDGFFEGCHPFVC